MELLRKGGLELCDLLDPQVSRHARRGGLNHFC
jgi:hypothetical protein